MDMSPNQVNDLITFLSTNETITELDISWNPISSHSVCDIFAALEKNKAIQSLNLGQIKMQNPKIEKGLPKFWNFI